jgi:hypothetical protein
MKPKELMYLLLAAAIFLVAGYVGYTQLVPQKRGPKTVTVETAGVIEAEFDADILTKVTDPTFAVDYNLPVDLDGLGNLAPFGK